MNTKELIEKYKKQIEEMQIKIEQRENLICKLIERMEK